MISTVQPPEAKGHGNHYSVLNVSQYMHSQEGENFTLI